MNQNDLEEIPALGMTSGVLQGKAHFEDSADSSFVPNDEAIVPWSFCAPTP